MCALNRSLTGLSDCENSLVKDVANFAFILAEMMLVDKKLEKLSIHKSSAMVKC